MTKEQAIECLVINDEQVHCFVQIGTTILVGADWELKEVKEYLENADSIEIGGEQCRKMQHGIAVIKGKEVKFFEANNELLDKYEMK